MTIQAFLVDVRTGQTLQRMSVGSYEVFDDMKFGENLEVVILSEDDADINTLETYFDSEGLVKIRKKSVDVEIELAVAKVQKLEAIKERRLFAEASGCQTKLGFIDTDPESQRKVNGSVTMAIITIQNNMPFEVDWTMADNTIVAHNASAMIEAGMAVGQHIANCHQKATQLKSLVLRALTLEEVEAIDIEQHWPK